MKRLDTELLAPAGSFEALVAALDSGADAVYFGLQTLNARHGAENFSLEKLPETVDYIHSKNARAFLTLNIDLTARDIGHAARVLTAAQDAGVDAILFTDPAILLLKDFFNDLEFHFSTQASITSTAGVQAAKDLGINRVVLAREMSAAEIEATCKVEGIEVEVFTQGALCLCISGRCLLSSWGGGRSGNRGACTSPCRVTWKVGSDDKEDILSTQDLSLIEKLPELIEAGVSCLKIEGRLKNASWVAKAVKLYRDVLDEKESYKKDDTLPLGAYTGRSMTDGYYTGQPHTVFGTGGRVASKAPAAIPAPSLPTLKTDTKPSEICIFNLAIMSEGKSLECEIEYDDSKENWTLPKTVIKHENRALTVSEAGSWLQQLTIQGAGLNEFRTDNPDFLVSKKAVNKIADRISSSIHRAKKKSQVKVKTEIILQDEVKKLTKFAGQNENNIFTPKDKPNTARIHIKQATEFLTVIQPEKVIVEHATIADLDLLQELCKNNLLIVALPPVFFEAKIPSLIALCNECKSRNISVEVNGWDSWKIAVDTGTVYEGGPGITVLNPLAAQALQKLGFKSISFSLEAGEKQLIDLSKSCPAEATLTVFSRPVLVHTRAGFPERIKEGTVLRDARGISLSINTYDDITELRSTKAYSVSGVDSPEIKARWLCVNLINSNKPINEWKNLPKKKNKEMFNFEKGLF